MCSFFFVHSLLLLILALELGNNFVIFSNWILLCLRRKHWFYEPHVGSHCNNSNSKSWPMLFLNAGITIYFIRFGWELMWLGYGTKWSSQMNKSEWKRERIEWRSANIKFWNAFHVAVKCVVIFIQFWDNKSVEKYELRTYVNCKNISRNGVLSLDKSHFSYDLWVCADALS